MDKLQQVIATIVSSPLSDQEKITWIQKFTAVANPAEFKTRLDEISQYFDSFAEKYEDEVRLYDKYLSILEKFQVELAQVQQKQALPIPPVAAQVSAAVTQTASAPISPTSNWTPADTTYKPAVATTLPVSSPVPPANAPPPANPFTNLSSGSTNDNAYQPLSLVPPEPVNPNKDYDEMAQIKQTIAQLQSQSPKRA